MKQPGYWYKVLHPEIFQGWGKVKNYFEGWYLKNVSADEKFVMAFIPGVAFDKEGRPEAFVQMIDGQEAETHYVSMPVGDFVPDPKLFDVKVGPNRFSERGFFVDLTQHGIDLVADLTFKNIEIFGATTQRPGIMGWYRYMPLMQCYHGLVSMKHGLTGKIVYKGQTIDMNNGTGYIEKDWGRSFPQSWVWMQSHNFDDPSVSFMLSIATIPWVTGKFTGFLGFLNHGDGHEIFATYTGAKVLEKSYDDGHLKIVIGDRKHRLTVETHQSEGGILKAPKNGSMIREVSESIDGNLNVKFEKQSGEIVFEGTGRKAGIEMVGDIQKLINGRRF